MGGGASRQSQDAVLPAELVGVLAAQPTSRGLSADSAGSAGTAASPSSTFSPLGGTPASWTGSALEFKNTLSHSLKKTLSLNRGADVQASDAASMVRRAPNSASSTIRTSRVIGKVEALVSYDSTTPEGRPARVIDEETRGFLSQVMRKHFVFSTLQEDDHSVAFSCMRCLEEQVGHIVFQQGDTGDSCYFIRSGAFTVTIDGKDLKTMGVNETFGELALLYQMRRTATVSCAEPGELWQMDSVSFHLCMEKLTSTQILRAETFFRSDANFSSLPPAQHRLLASLCTVQTFESEDVIMRQGEGGGWMFIVMSGTVVNMDEKLSTVPQRTGTIIGSVGIIYGKKQLMGVRAKGIVKCLALAKHALPELSEHAEDVVRRCAFKDLLHCLPRGKDTFAQLTGDQLDRLVSTAEDGSFEPGEIICCPGDPGCLLVVIDGEMAIAKSQAIAIVEKGGFIFCGPGTNLLQIAEKVIKSGSAYGEHPEFALGTLMSRYVVAITRVRAHRLSNAMVLASLGEPLTEVVRLNEVKRVLSDIFLFKNLREDQIDSVVRRLEQQRFQAGEVIVKQDDPAKHFFLIQWGTISVRKGDTVLRTLGRWDYFGERGLLLQECRSATCEAVEECACLVLDEENFFNIVGKFKKELERRMHLQDLSVELGDLKTKAIVGRGTFGVVRLVHPKRKEKTLYALKCVKKSQVVSGGQEKAIVMEKDVNAQCYHPCIMQFIKTFQDRHHIYFLTEFLGGGDLFFALREIGSVSKLQSQFFSGSITLALEYLHARGIMYRDLKPENVLLDFEGCAKLVDFGCCKQEMRTSTLIGTPEYMAPEVISGKGYTCIVDWWSLGVMLYEFIVGPLPFGADADDQMGIFRAILHDPLVFPDYTADETAVALMQGMLSKEPERRLGGTSLGAREIKEEAYYEGFNWDALAGGFLEPPWRPDADALMRNWEPPDGDLMDHVSKELVTFGAGLEWAKDF